MSLFLPYVLNGGVTGITVWNKKYKLKININLHGRGGPKNSWKRDPEKEMWTAGYKWRAGGRWRRQHRTELKMDKSGLVAAYVPTTGSDKLNSRQIKINIQPQFSHCNYKLENGRYGHTLIQYDPSIRVYTTADTDTDTSTPCVGVPATCVIRQGRSLRERSLDAMGGTCRPLATHKLARSVSFMTG